MLKAGLTAAGLMLSLPAWAQAPTTQAPNIIELREGSQTVLQVSRPFSSVAVGNPEVAEVLPRSDRVLILVGKKVGTSDIMIFSDAEKLHHATIVVVPTNVQGKVFNHNQKVLGEYKAYQCNPVCQRTDDKYEQRTSDLIVLGGGASATGGSINLILPPAAPAR